MPPRRPRLRGTCAVCHQVRMLTTDGLMCRHKASLYLPWCLGSYEKPLSTSDDKEER